MKKILIVLLLAPPSIMITQYMHSMQIEKKHLSVPGRLGNVSVFKTDNGFEIEESNSTRVAVPSYRTSKDIRNMKTHQLASFIRNGYIAVNQSTDGEYSLDMHERLKAGGPILAYWFYGITKATCWGAVIGASLYGAKTIISDAGQALGDSAGVMEHVIGDKAEKAAAYALMKEVGQNYMTSGAGIPRVISGNLPGIAIYVADKVSQSEDASHTVGMATVGVTLAAEPARQAVVGTYGIVAGTIELISLGAGAIGAWIPWL